MSSFRLTTNPSDATELALPGLEVDNLLAQLSLLGLLEALESARPEWKPRAFWRGPPWEARLLIQAEASDDDVAEATVAGIEKVAGEYDAEGRKNVGEFTPETFREFLQKAIDSPVKSRFAASMLVEHPRKRDGGLLPAPLVMIFGQGHQNFLERIIRVPLGEGATGSTGKKTAKKRATNAPVDLQSPAKLKEALFEPWRREDATEAFRWDPDEDQRYALRYSEPSGAGAAKTVHGANRLAALGFMSFATAPGLFEVLAPGTSRTRGEVKFRWPVWSVPLSLAGIRRLLDSADLIEGRTDRLLAYGVGQVYEAGRISNGKYMNVTRGVVLVK